MTPSEKMLEKLLASIAEGYSSVIPNDVDNTVEAYAGKAVFVFSQEDRKTLSLYEHLKGSPARRIALDINAMLEAMEMRAKMDRDLPRARDLMEE